MSAGKWHLIFLWLPKKIHGRWYWLKFVARRWESAGMIPLYDGSIRPPAGWAYRPYPNGRKRKCGS